MAAAGQGGVFAAAAAAARINFASKVAFTFCGHPFSHLPLSSVQQICATRICFSFLFLFLFFLRFVFPILSFRFFFYTAIGFFSGISFSHGKTDSNLRELERSRTLPPPFSCPFSNRLDLPSINLALTKNSRSWHWPTKNSFKPCSPAVSTRCLLSGRASPFLLLLLLAFYLLHMCLRNIFLLHFDCPVHNFTPAIALHCVCVCVCLHCLQLPIECCV